MNAAFLADYWPVALACGISFYLGHVAGSIRAAIRAAELRALSRDRASRL